MNKLLELAGFLALMLGSTPAAARCLHYGPPSVHITGYISRVLFPPAAGSNNTATRANEYSWYFTTERPICITAGDKRMGNVPFAGVQHFEILPPSLSADLAPFLGNAVVLNGQFLASQLPHYHQLTFSVESANVQHAP